MNLKLNTEEERRRTGRYIAILVGILLLILAIYQAWVRRIPVVASLVVPALIMFVYVGWVLYSASRDKQRLLDAEAALHAAAQETAEDGRSSELSHNMEISMISSKETSKTNSPDSASHKDWTDLSTVLRKAERNREERSVCFVKPIILVNDKLPEELDQKWSHIVEVLSSNDKYKAFRTRRKFKRKFCRSRRHATFKRSYSIA